LIYQDLTYIRNEKIDNVESWVWLKDENGVWDGPSKEWKSQYKEIFLSLLKDKKCVIQAGGALGMYPRLMSDIFDVVYTFEPDPLSFYCLVQNCQKDNIYKYQAALGGSHAMVEVIRTNMENVGMNSVKQNENFYTPQLMIDDLNLKQCDMIALDVEGYEFNALVGGLNTIATHKPLIIVENDTVEVKDILSQYGYIKKTQHCADSFYVVP
jgi:FkbM family methyltransferase